MAFVASPLQDFECWDYLTGSFYDGMSITADRYDYLLNIFYDYPLKIALRDPSTNKWTKHVEFPGLLWESKFDEFDGTSTGKLTAAIDVHRSMLNNEIVIESDYPTYEENYEASKVIGTILEEKGFIPHYYFSGNKSIHCHVYITWDFLNKINIATLDQLKIIFQGSKLRFQKKFMKWLRTRMIHCWDTNTKKFDEDLIRDTHMIRCELSKNKRGYKTFLGYTYKDMSFIPYICNEHNRIYPKLGKIKLSQPHNIQKLIEEFIEEIKIKTKIDKIHKKNKTLNDWGVKNSSKGLRTCVKYILSDDFKKAKDCYQRAFFILLNELKQTFGTDQARIIINDWNARMDFPVTKEDIELRLKSKKIYSLSENYILKILKEAGIEISKK